MRWRGGGDLCGTVHREWAGIHPAKAHSRGTGEIGARDGDLCAAQAGALLGGVLYDRGQHADRAVQLHQERSGGRAPCGAAIGAGAAIKGRHCVVIDAISGRAVAGRVGEDDPYGGIGWGRIAACEMGEPRVPARRGHEEGAVRCRTGSARLVAAHVHGQRPVGVVASCEVEHDLGDLRGRIAQGNSITPLVLPSDPDVAGASQTEVVENCGGARRGAQRGGEPQQSYAKE